MVTTRASAAAPASAVNAQIDAVSKERTMSHMNKDHSEDMAAILQHFNGLSASAAANAQMLDIDLHTMTIQSATGTHEVHVVPPMDAWNDRRGRLIDMTLEARKALGLDINDNGSHGPSASGTAIRWAPPAGSDWLVFAGLTGYYVCAGLVFGGLAGPGSAVSSLLTTIHFPYGPEAFRWLVKAILLPVLAIHVAEAIVLDRSRLQPGGLQRGSKLWCLWIFSAFTEGLPAYRRWDKIVEGQNHAKAH